MIKIVLWVGLFFSLVVVGILGILAVCIFTECVIIPWFKTTVLERIEMWRA